MSGNKDRRIKRLCDDCFSELQPGQPRRCAPCFQRLLVDCAGCGASMVALPGYDFCVACTADIDEARERFSIGVSSDLSIRGFASCLDDVRREFHRDAELVSDDVLLHLGGVE